MGALSDFEKLFRFLLVLIVSEKYIECLDRIKLADTY